jgi:hypothetical protein
MGLRIRKIVRILPGVRVNLSKGGGSLSLGGRGLSVNLGKDGVRTTAGMPGSGISYSTRAPWAAGGAGFKPWAVVAAVAALLVLAYLAFGA